jgi:hypothetical protein
MVLLSRAKSLYHNELALLFVCMEVGLWTTHFLTVTAARNFCNTLLKAGTLIPNRIAKVMTFVDFANGFWERGSEYVKKQDGRKDITDSYLSNCQKYVANQLLPFFGTVALDKIIEKEIDKWLLGFKDRARKQTMTERR